VAVGRERTRGTVLRSTRVAWLLAGVTVLLVVVVDAMVLAGATDPVVNPAVPSAALSALSVLLVAFGIPAFVRRLDLDMGRLFPWFVGLVSVVLSIVPWVLVHSGQASWATVLYRGLRVPQGTVEFWDLSLVLKSIDCASFGFDVYAPNNGCLQDPSIYGPGTLWLQYVPFHVFSERNASWIGAIAMVLSSLVVVWLARLSTGRGQAALLAAAVGAPWLLLLERGNFDAFVIWAAVLLAFLVRRWNRLWAWTLGAAVIWLIGTWKYYPFALGLMLIPVLRLRRGWTVLAGYVVATAAFVVVTWDNAVFSLQSNGEMPLELDLVILGRTPVVFRMHGGDGDPSTIQAGDVVIGFLVLAAFAWGLAIGGLLRRVTAPLAMLAVGGSSLFLASVLGGGFGYAYKAAFLLLAVPLLSRPARARRRVVLYSSVVMLVLVAIASIVVWNTVMATTAGLVAAGFAFGAAVPALLRRGVSSTEGAVTGG
jgi:hypothetical protein